MKVGLIGGGHIARIHGGIIRNLPGVKLVAVTDPDKVRGESLAKDLGANCVYQDASEMLQKESLDAVHILVPPHLHADLTILALENNCHVMVEKPMATTTQDARRMLELAQSKSLMLCPNHNYVCDNLVLRCKKLIEDGVVGELISVDANWFFDPKRYPVILEEGAEFEHWSFALNGGPLEDMFPHAASLVLEFLGEIETVDCMSSNRNILPQPWHDELRVQLKSGNKFGRIVLSLAERPDTVALVLRGTQGTIEIDWFTGNLVIKQQSKMPRAVARGMAGFSLAKQSFNGSFANIFNFIRGKVDKTNGLENLVTNFYASISSKEKIAVTAEFGLRVVELTEKVWPEPVNKTLKQHVRPLPIKKPEILVTGASGFIGARLVDRLLKDNIGVRCLVRKNSMHGGKLLSRKVEIIEGDLSDKEIVNKACEGVRVVIHAGATLSNDWGEHQRTNIDGTENILDASVRNHVERFVFVSSLAVYDIASKKTGDVVKEEDRYIPDPMIMGPYYHSKIEGEKLVHKYIKEHDLAASIVRPGLVTGPDGPIFFQQLGYQIKDAIFLMIGKGKNILPLTYVDNTVEGIINAARLEQAIGKTYNLIDDGSITGEEYVKFFKQETKRDSKLVKLPYILPYAATLTYEMAAKFGLMPKGVTSRAQLAWKQANVIFSNTKANSELGDWQVISLQQGLKDSFKWYIDRQNRFGA